MVESRDRLMLPWSYEARESLHYRTILCTLLVVMVVVSLWLPYIQLPAPDREKQEQLPPQLARLVVPKEVQKEQPKPEPKEESKPEPEKTEEPKPEPKKDEPKKDEPKKDVVKKVEQPKQPPKQTVKQAREVAKKEMQNLMDDLADMRSSVDMGALKKDVKPRVESTIAAKASAISSSRVASRSGGIDTSGLAAPAEKISLAQHDGTNLNETKKEKQLGQAEAEAALQSHIRSNESIELAAEKIKGSFDKHYQRELRKDPFLEGKVVLEVVIEPGGEVSACRLISSELNNKALEAKFVSLMKQFDFGSEDVAQRTVKLPFTFKPS